MMIHCFLALAFTAYGNLQGFPRQQSSNYTVLDSTQASSLVTQCSRWAPTISSAWNPRDSDIANLEHNLGAIQGLTADSGSIIGVRIVNPSAFLRQYVGVVIGTKRFVYVNAFPLAEFEEWPSSVQRPDWRREPYIVCDGGESYWGVLFDPVTCTFWGLATNGIG